MWSRVAIVSMRTIRLKYLHIHGGEGQPSKSAHAMAKMLLSVGVDTSLSW